VTSQIKKSNIESKLNFQNSSSADESFLPDISQSDICSKYKLNKKASYIKILGDYSNAQKKSEEIHLKRLMLQDIQKNWN
jgi:hypothetical protein